MAPSPLARAAYCISTREATRLTYTSGLSMPWASASKKPAQIFQNARDCRSVCAAANPMQVFCISAAAPPSAFLTMRSTALSKRARASAP